VGVEKEAWFKIGLRKGHPMKRSTYALPLFCCFLTMAGRGEEPKKAEPKPPPAEWVESTGHRVIRLSQAPGSSSFYFHQNAYTATGDKLVISTREGLATIDLKTRKIELVVKGRAGNVIVGKKTRQVFYTKGNTVYATHLDTRATREVAKLPAEWGRGSGLAINADETLLAGSATTGKGKARPKGAGRKGSLEARWAARVPMVLYSIEIKTGAIKKLHSATDWLNHVQFSPSAPNLLMFCHEGPGTRWTASGPFAPMGPGCARFMRARWRWRSPDTSSSAPMARPSGTTCKRRGGRSFGWQAWCWPPGRRCGTS
jgi:hypothetical protein